MPLPEAKPADGQKDSGLGARDSKGRKPTQEKNYIVGGNFFLIFTTNLKVVRVSSWERHMYIIPF